MRYSYHRMMQHIPGIVDVHVDLGRCYSKQVFGRNVTCLGYCFMKERWFHPNERGGRLHITRFLISFHTGSLAAADPSHFLDDPSHLLDSVHGHWLLKMSITMLLAVVLKSREPGKERLFCMRIEV